MPSVSTKQRKAMGAALAVKRGKMPRSRLYGASQKMLSMTEDELSEFASKPVKKTRKKQKG